MAINNGGRGRGRVRSIIAMLGAIFAFTWSTWTSVDAASSIGEVVYAINAGGDAHTDINGVRFERDPYFSTKTDTIASDFGKQLLIGRVGHPADMILYQTERYHHASFGYDIPIREDGDYVLVMKFSEVYFTAPNMKIFSVTLNDAINVIQNLDIFARVGRGVAHDEYVPFTVASGGGGAGGGGSPSGVRLRVAIEEVPFANRILRVDFVKSPYDNPKVNAIYVMKGKLADVPKLMALEAEEDLFKDDLTTPEQVPLNLDDQHRQDQQLHQQQQQKAAAGSRQPIRRPSGPRTPDPYGLDESSTMLPVCIAIVAFIPILFCLCKL